MKDIFLTSVWGFLLIQTCVNGFSPSFATTKRWSCLPASSSTSSDADEELEIQWNLFTKHHAKGAWRGIWTTYDYIGDVIDETVASVNFYNKNDSMDVIEQTHSVVSGAKRSDCATCFDSFDIKEFPVALYDRRRPDTKNMFSKTRLAANAMINGPTLLRSGVMATELVLAWGDGRVRVVFQHAPVWLQGVEPGAGPPQGLKLVRTMISREALRDSPPTAETEAANPPAPNNPIFYRSVPPFNWHKKWAGTSWTWGPNAGDKGWAIEKLEEEDSWQGIATVERWNLRLPGGIFVQAPRVITDMQAELCRLAWLPDDETLLRVEAGCLALQPMIMEDDQLVGFYPPTLASLRCDILKKMGELDQVPSFVQEQTNTAELMKPQAENDIRQTAAEEKEDNNTQKGKLSSPKTDPVDVSEGDDSGLDAIRRALSL